MRPSCKMDKRIVYVDKKSHVNGRGKLTEKLLAWTSVGNNAVDYLLE